jgi:hypothetical protein
MGLRRIRRLDANSLRGIEPAGDIGAPPRIEWVDPTDLYVDEAYQREVGKAGAKLIRQIVAEFSWLHFKPPICVEVTVSGRPAFKAIDGQHTATGAATHSAVGKIPVVVVDAAEVERQARAFVAHNRNRVTLTQVGIFKAELAAKDTIALVVGRACKAAGVRVQNQSDKNPRGTAAVASLRSLAIKAGPTFLTRVLTVLACRGWLKAQEIGAVALVLTSFGDRDGIDARLTKVITSKTAHEWAAEVQTGTGEPIASLLAAAWAKTLTGERTQAQTARGTLNTARMIDRMRPEVPSKPPPKAALPAEPPPPKKALGVVIRNGVTLDTDVRMVARRGRLVTLDEKQFVLVAALVPVMPACLDNGPLIRKLFGTSPFDGAPALRALVDQTNPLLADVGLELRPVGRMGLMLATT